MTAALQMIPLTSLAPSSTGAQTERRRNFDKVALAELADSIRKVGLLQPIVARPSGKDGGFEIVAGERRWMAAKQAGLDAVPVTVRDLTDEQVLEIQLVENLQREGLHELAEAEGYEALMKSHGYTVDQLVDKLARSRAYVYSRLKLLALAKESRKAFYEGKLNASTALLLARIPDGGLQKQALKELTEETRWAGRMSVRMAQEHVQQKYMLRLSEAGFPTDAADLVPAVGPCTTCPKRTGNQPELFGDVKSADVCTDPACFQKKRAAQTALRIADATSAGQTVITGAAAKKLISGAYSSPVGYVKLDDHCYEDPKNRRWRQVIGKAVTPVLIENVHNGVLVEAVPEKDARAALKAAGIVARADGGGEDYHKRAREQADKAKAERRFREAVLRETAARAPGTVPLDELALGLFRLHDVTMQERLLKFAGIEVDAKRGSSGDTEGRLHAHLQKVDPGTLARFLWTALLVDDITNSYVKPTRLLAAAKLHGVDVDAINKQLKAEASAKKKAKVKAGGKPKANGGAA